MKKDEKKIVEVESIDEEQKEKKKLAVKVAVFVGIVILIGGTFTIGFLLVRNNKESPDKKGAIDAESTILTKGNEAVDVPTKAPVDNTNPDDLEPIVVGPSITPDEIDPNEVDSNEIDNGEELVEVIPVEPVTPVEPIEVPTITPTPGANQGGSNQGINGNEVEKATPTPKPTVKPEPTVAPTPTTKTEKDDEYDKEMYEKFIKAGEDFTSYLKKNKYSVIEGKSLYDVYAYMYLINADYLDNGTVKKLVNDGILDVANLIDGISGFSHILYASEGKILLNGDKFMDMSNLCLNDTDKKNTTQFINAVNTLAGTDPDKTYEAIDNFIFASKNDKKTKFTLTVDEMNVATLIVYIDSARTFRNVLSSAGLDKSFIDPIRVDGGDEYIDDLIADLTRNYKAIN